MTIYYFFLLFLILKLVKLKIIKKLIYLENLFKSKILINPSVELLAKKLLLIFANPVTLY